MPPGRPEEEDAQATVLFSSNAVHLQGIAALAVFCVAFITSL
jgi:hypothetical protein